VVSRTQNLTKAAQELHISQSAVSKQLNVLQSYLGVELFRRERHGVSLTSAGKRYSEAVIPAFDALSNATTDLMRSVSDTTLRIRTYTTFAAKWLIPRLSDFHARYPDITVKITNSVHDVDFNHDNVDLAIQVGNGAWPGQSCDFLFEDIIEPVCSPDFYKRHAPDPRCPQTLLRVRLLISHFRPDDWQTWARQCRYAQEIENTESMRFSSSILTWQAAAEGLGIAMGQRNLLTEDLTQGRLITPFNLPVKTGRSYYLVRPQLQRHSRKVEIFRGWIQSQMEGIERH